MRKGIDMIVLANIKPKPGVYRLRNTVTHKKYIGSAVNLKRRLTQHRFSLKTLTQGNKELDKDCELYGSDSFVFEVIKYCESREEALDYEQYLFNMIVKDGRWHLYYNNSQNSRSPKGYKHDAAFKRYRSENNFFKGKFGALSHSAKPVKAICVKTGACHTFGSAMCAIRAGIGIHPTAISRCCQGKSKTHNKHYWEHV